MRLCSRSLTPFHLLTSLRPSLPHPSDCLDIPLLLVPFSGIVLRSCIQSSALRASQSRGERACPHMFYSGVDFQARYFLS